MSTNLIPRFVLSCAAFAVAALTSFVDIAHAKPMSCAHRQSSCVERCIMGNSSGKENGCIQRTCNHQYNKCMEDSSSGAERGAGGRGARGTAGGGGGKSSGKPIVRDHRDRG